MIATAMLVFSAVIAAAGTSVSRTVTSSNCAPATVCSSVWRSAWRWCQGVPVGIDDQRRVVPRPGPTAGRPIRLSAGHPAVFASGLFSLPDAFHPVKGV